jgi:hypothetical protein
MDNAVTGQLPLVVELVGPAGAGKTTLLQVLSQSDPKVLIGAHPQIRNIGHLPFFIWNALLLLPVFLRLFQNRERLTWPDIARVIRLKGWPRFLGRQMSNVGQVIILDQGPVYTLATLRGFGPEGLNSQGLERWWHGMLKQWASILDMIIWLDAPNTVLMTRINTRGKVHSVKGKSDQAAFEFLAQYRAAYEEVISMLSINASGPKVLRFDTAQVSLDEIANRVLATCNLKHGKDDIAHQDARQAAI